MSTVTVLVSALLSKGRRVRFPARLSVFPARLSVGALLVGAGALVPLQSGCGARCTGVGCAEEYGASRIGVHFGSVVDRIGLQNPRRSNASIVGDRAAGVDWSVEVVDQRLWVGMPDLGEVRSYTLGAGDRLEHTDHDGRFFSNLGDDRFGASIHRLGDADGDGGLDMVVTAPLRSPTDLMREAGAVYILPEPILDEGTGNLDTNPVRTITGPQSGARFGESMAVCPDMDGDGRPELLVGMPWYDHQPSRAATVYLAGAAALVLSTTYPTVGGTRSVDDAEIWTGSDDGARAGTALACTDVIGDASPDLIISAPYADGDHEGEGAIYIIDGSTRRAGELSVVADRVLSGASDNGWLGWSMATGDLNGDGRTDLLAGSPGHTLSVSGEVSRPQGLALVWDGADLEAGLNDTARFRIAGVAEGDAVGRTVEVVDLDADGFDDLLVGAPRLVVNEAYDAGALFVYRGQPDHAGLRAQLDTRDATYWWEAERDYLQTGGTLAVGDLNGDDLADLLLVHRRQPG